MLENIRSCRNSRISRQARWNWKRLKKKKSDSMKFSPCSCAERKGGGGGPGQPENSLQLFKSTGWSISLREYGGRVLVLAFNEPCHAFHGHYRHCFITSPFLRRVFSWEHLRGGYPSHPMSPTFHASFSPVVSSDVRTVLPRGGDRANVTFFFCAAPSIEAGFSTIGPGSRSLGCFQCRWKLLSFSLVFFFFFF